MRPYWKGQIRLSLVTLGVEIYPAVATYKTIPLHEIYKPSGKRIRHQNVVDDEAVNKDDIVKGFEYEKGEYVLLEPEEIQKIKIPSSKELEIIQFVDAGSIDPLYFDRPYFVIPQNNASENAFITIRDALKETNKFGLGQLVIGGHERLCALKPCGRGMMLEVIRYEDEVKKADAYFKSIDEKKINKEQLDLAKSLIKKKSGKFDPGKFHDHYNEALQELINSKIQRRKPKYTEKKQGAKIVNIMDALKKSLGESDEKPARSKTKPAAKKTAAKKPAAKKIATKKVVAKKSVSKKKTAVIKPIRGKRKAA